MSYVFHFLSGVMFLNDYYCSVITNTFVTNHCEGWTSISVSSLSLHLHVLSFGRLILVALVVGRQRAGRPPATFGDLPAACGVPGAEGPAQRHGPARTAAGHLHRGGVGVILAWLRAGALASRLQRHLLILLAFVAVLKEEAVREVRCTCCVSNNIKESC